MADRTGIEWTDATWNPIRGCSRVSEGCRNCYAETVAARFSGPGQPYEGLATRVTRANGTSEARWTGKVRAVNEALTIPLKWRKPRRVFVNSMSDLFHEEVSHHEIDRIFAVMALAPQHTFQVLTKRPERMRDYIASRTRPDEAGRAAEDIRVVMTAWLATPSWRQAHVETAKHIPPGKFCQSIRWPLPNVWLGVSVEDQATADARIPPLLDTPAAVRFVSAEPLLGPVDLTWIAEPDEEKDGVIDALLGINWIDGQGRGVAYRPTRPGHKGRVMTRHIVSSDDEIMACRKLDWVIVGGESGARARPMHPDWARLLRDQCKAAHVPFFFKQWGKWAAHDHIPEGWEPAENPLCVHGDEFTAFPKAVIGRLLDGATHDEMPGGSDA